MKLNKAVIQRIVRETAAKDPTLNREEKWKVFLNVCDNAFNEGRITKKQHKLWTEPF